MFRPQALAPKVVRTGEDGSFEFRGLEPGAVSFSLLAMAGNGSMHSPLEIPSRSRDGIVLHLQRGTGRLKGRVIDAHGAPAPNQDCEGYVNVLGQSYLASAPTRTDEDGRFVLEELPEWSWVSEYSVFLDPARCSYSVTQGQQEREIRLPEH